MNDGTTGMCQILGRISELENRICRSQSEELNDHTSSTPPAPLHLANHHVCMYTQTAESAAFSLTWVHTLVCYIFGKDGAFRWPPSWDILTHIFVDRQLKIIGVKQIFCETASTAYPGLFLSLIYDSEILDSGFWESSSGFPRLSEASFLLTTWAVNSSLENREGTFSAWIVLTLFHMLSNWKKCDRGQWENTESSPCNLNFNLHGVFWNMISAGLGACLCG